MPPLYSIKPSFRNLFKKKLTRDRVVPIISANVCWLILRYHPLGPALFSEVGEQEERPGQPLFTGIEELVNQVFLDAEIPRQEL
jgi:hypothetical protein